MQCVIILHTQHSLHAGLPAIDGSYRYVFEGDAGNGTLLRMLGDWFIVFAKEHSQYPQTALGLQGRGSQMAALHLPLRI